MSIVSQPGVAAALNGLAFAVSFTATRTLPPMPEVPAASLDETQITSIYFNAQLNRKWVHVCGDWIDVHGIPMGADAWGELPPMQELWGWGNPPRTLRIDITPLARYWLSHNCGLILRRGGLTCASRNHADPACHPYLDVDGARYPCIADATMNGSTVVGFGMSEWLRTEGWNDAQTIAMQFDLTGIASSFVRAELVLYAPANESGWGAGAYLLNPPPIGA